MAEGGVNPELSKEDDLLYCSVCMEEYEDPRALPCLHTFCYKCLVQLTMKEAMVAPTEKQLAYKIANLLNFLDKQNTLKCPLCSEEHPIPKDKGVAGFRKDFRINQLIQQQRSKYHEAVQKDSEPKDTSDTDVDKCKDHPDEKLLYHCENAACKCDICQICWAEYHDKHRVILLSKRVKDAKDVLREEVSKIATEISSQIAVLSKTEKELIEQFTTVETDLKQRLADILEKLKEAHDDSFAQLESQRQSQEKKIADKLESLRTLQDTFHKIQHDLEKEERAQTSTTVNEYQLLHGQMKQLSVSISQWNFLYTTVLLPTYNFSNFIKRAALIKYQDAHLGEIPEIKTTEVQLERKENSAQTYTDKAPATGDPKQSAQGIKPEVMGSSTSQKDCAKGGKVSGTIKLKYETYFCAKDEVKTLAASNNTLYVATKKHLSHYEMSPFKKTLEKALGTTADALGWVTSKSDNCQFLVKLNAKGKTLTFSCLERNSVYVHSLEKEPLEYLASSGNSVSYAYKENNKLHVTGLSVDDNLPRISPFGTCAQIPFESGKMGSLCMHISNRGNPIVVCTNVFVLGKSKRSETALLTVVITKQIGYSRITFDELDSKAYNFNLCSIVCDSDNIFTLNTAENTMYVISKIGKIVQKVSVEGASFALSSGKHICLEAKGKYLYVVSDKDMISIFRYH